MRHWLLISFFLLVSSAFIYYALYGRLHNKVEPRLNIRYQQTPTHTPVSVVNSDTTPTEGTNLKEVGSCPALGKKQDVHARYVQSSAKDCGALNDNDAVMEESQSKDILRCLEGTLTPGLCGNSKAFLSLQGFEGSVEIFIESKECKLILQQWSTTSPECGYTKKECSKISSRFPFSVCDNAL